jgi:dedicator of cytokinesis protein 3
MIISEYHQSEHFDGIENALVNRLDSLFMSDSKGDDISRAFFVSHLRHLFDSSEVNEQLRERVSHFLDSVDLFLELLLSVRGLPDGEEYADDRVIATVSKFRHRLTFSGLMASLAAASYEFYTKNWPRRDLY